ncbi:MAG: ECF transporter S component [Firmicutes bacterium]|nr:ECF transporter S component [Bacillota bacterium]
MENVVARRKTKNMDTSKIVKIGMLGAVSIVLMMFELALPIFPTFLKIDISDLPALIGAVTMGPLAGVMIELVKNVLHLFKTSTAGVGELANFIVGVALVLPTGMFYKKYKNVLGFAAGAVLGCILMVIAACIFNYYVLIPAYAVAFGAPVEAFVEMAGSINSAVVDLKTLVFFAIAPFNVIKAVLVSVIGYPMCSMLKKVLK